jgi:hypothetical protein
MLITIHGMVISVAQLSKIEFADWLGVLAQPVVAERFLHKIRANPRLKQQKKIKVGR